MKTNDNNCLRMQLVRNKNHLQFEVDDDFYLVSKNDVGYMAVGTLYSMVLGDLDYYPILCPDVAKALLGELPDYVEVVISKSHFEGAYCAKYSGQRVVDVSRILSMGDFNDKTYVSKVKDDGENKGALLIQMTDFAWKVLREFLGGDNVTCDDVTFYWDVMPCGFFNKQPS